MLIKINSKVKLIFIFIIAIISVIILKETYKLFINDAYPIKYQSLVEKYSKEYEVDKSLIYSIIRTESHFNKNAKSYADARGLMQLTPETFEWLQTKVPEDEAYDTEDLYDEEINIKYGTKFLQLLIEEFDDYKTVACAYHAGRGNVNSWLSDESLNDGAGKLKYIPIEDTRIYADRVISTIFIYDQILKEREN